MFHPSVQRGHPAADSNACQLVLKYMLVNKKLFTKAYHDRMYYYSSGTKFNMVTGELSQWMDKQQKAYDRFMEDPPPETTKPFTAKQCLKRLIDQDGLYGLLGDAIIQFMRLKPTAYGSLALMSKQDFWRVKLMKRAMTFVFMLRYLLGYESQKQWTKFSVDDYKLNTRSFKRWCDKDHLIFAESTKYDALPATYVPPPTAHKRRYRTSTSEVSEDSPMKRRFVVNDESTSEDE